MKHFGSPGTVLTIFLLSLGLVIGPGGVAAQQTELSGWTTSETALAASAATAVPQLVPYNGVAVDAQGRPIGESAAITFQVFREEEGGEPLWWETQTVAVDSSGHYKAQLGATLPNGIPVEVFSTW